MTDAFEKLVSLLDYPMFVVTTRVDDQSAGCLVGFTSHHTFRVAEGATYLAVHLIERRHSELARLFGGETGDEVDKFARCAWRSGPNEMPILDGAPGWFVGEVLSRYDLGDHVGFLLEPVDGSAPDKFDQLVTFSDVRDLDPGHDA
jgi:flavin reductase (DIM6/NTAB) family NADH-FMN oxidoreductase RutF